MARDKVSAKILSDAKARVKEIEADFADRKRKLLNEQQEGKKTYRAETRKLAEQESQRISREILTEARLAARRETLTVRHELIEKALDKAAEKFVKSKTYPGLLTSIVEHHGKGSQIILSPADRKRFKSSAWAKKAEEASVKGGVILRTPQQDLNFTIDAAFEFLGEQLSLELAEILDGEEKQGAVKSKGFKKK